MHIYVSLIFNLLLSFISLKLGVVHGDRIMKLYSTSREGGGAVVTPTDCHNSFRNRRVIKLFGGIFCVVTLPF